MARRRDRSSFFGSLLVGRLQDVDRRLRLAVAQARVGHHRVDHGRAGLGAQGDLPHARGLPIAAQRRKRGAQVEGRGEELAAIACGDLQLRGRLGPLALREQIEAAQERGHGLIPGVQRLEGTGAVPAFTRFGDGVLQRRRPLFRDVQEARHEIASEHGLPIEGGERGRERLGRLHASRGRQHRAAGSPLEDERARQHADGLAGASDAGTSHVAARGQERQRHDARRPLAWWGASQACMRDVERRQGA